MDHVKDDGARTARHATELAVLTGTRLQRAESARPSLPGEVPRTARRYEDYLAVIFKSAKSATVSSSVQSPTVPRMNRSSRSIIFSAPS
jgi:hypothetical protein